MCREAGDIYNRGDALNNLGAIEHMTGDLAAAARYYRAAYDMFSSGVQLVGTVTPATNLALMQIELGQYADAEKVLGEARSNAVKAGYRLGEAQVLERLAEVKVAQRRLDEALIHIRAGLALADSIGPASRTGIVWTFGRTLAAMDSVEAAIRVLEGEAARFTGAVAPFEAALLELELASLLTSVGRHGEALRPAQRALDRATRSGSLDLEFRARTQIGVSRLRLGQRAAARADLESAAERWETHRARQTDPETRAYLSASARLCVSGLLETYLDGAEPGSTPGAVGAGADAGVRAAKAFAAIERFKARTLRERMRGPWTAGGEGPVARPVTLEEVQRSVLRDDELLLDAFDGPTLSVMVAATASDSRVIVWPGGMNLAPRLDRLRSLASSRPSDSRGADSALLNAALGRVGESLLAPVADLLARSRRVIVVTDEGLAMLPWAALAMPGPSAHGPEPLCVAREVVLVPSAGILADLRARAMSKSDGSRRMLAVAGGSPGGEDLPGAAREVRDLGARYDGVDVRTSARGTLGANLEPYDVLHFAAHATLDDQHPWRSGIRVGARSVESDDEYLRAAQIASLGLSARLAVLSSCESAGGRMSSGEGMQGLSAAFVTAGVPATVATLWPVSDRVTAKFMEAFYGYLAEGGSVAGALRAAQLDIRSRAAYRHPFYWAGFVVLGDGDVRVPLRVRRDPIALAAPVLVVAAGIGIGWAVHRRRAGVTKPGERTLTT
jgi:CHAT domain-containing protein/tetratricopeptide (TPR) repeat protein